MLNVLKKTLVFAVATALCFPVEMIHAKEKEGLTEEEAEQIAERMFSDLDDNDKVLKTEDGGYLYGEAYITSIDNDEVLYTLNSETDPNSQTVESAKAEVVDSWLNEDTGIQPRAATTPSQRMVLGPGDAYRSGTFSGSGWRFSGYMFAPRPDTGYYLLWTSYGDDGRVGNLTEAQNTLNGSIQGDCIYNGTPTYINKATLSHVYYTYNPVAGSYYLVQNI